MRILVNTAPASAQTVREPSRNERERIRRAELKRRLKVERQAKGMRPRPRAEPLQSSLAVAP